MVVKITVPAHWSDSCTLGVGCTTSPVGITTDAVDIHLDNASLFGGTVSGDIIIGQSFAGLASAVGESVPEPGSLLLLGMGLAGIAAVRRRMINQLT